MSSERKKKLTIELEINDSAEIKLLLKRLIDSDPAMITERTINHGSAMLKSNCVYVVDWSIPTQSVDENGNLILTYKSDFK